VADTITIYYEGRQQQRRAIHVGSYFFYSPDILLTPASMIFQSAGAAVAAVRTRSIYDEGVAAAAAELFKLKSIFLLIHLTFF
jgi:hypothetical protein